ncbi:DUF481 domain-containing protein [Flavitalea sp.]|nr:DUF481 domain-containing protein [Flavitalea sp.]
MRTIATRVSLIIISLTLSLTGVAQKTDKVFLKNGDVITGEIKSMQLAKLSFDMNGPGIISIKWEEVVQVRSVKTFQVTLQKGDVLLVKLDSLFFTSQHVNLDDIVEIVQIKNTFFKRLSGDVNFGFNYNKSSDIFQLNFAGSITYRKPKLERNFSLNTVLSRASSDTITSKKQDATFSDLRKLKHLYYLMSTLGWERNTQLDLANRYLVTFGGGKILFNNNHQRLLTGVGISYNEEKFYESNAYQSNVEALAIIQFKKFHYSSPKISIDAQYVVYPSLSNWGRVRMNLQVNTSVEVFKDFMVGFTFYDNYDSRPSAGAASNNDYGLTFSIGYKFGK